MLAMVDISCTAVNPSMLLVGRDYLLRRQVPGTASTTRDLTISNNRAQVAGTVPPCAFHFNYFPEKIALNGTVNPTGGLVVGEPFAWKDVYTIRVVEAGSFTLQVADETMNCSATVPPSGGAPQYTVLVDTLRQMNITPRVQLATVVVRVSGNYDSDGVPLDLQQLTGVLPTFAVVESDGDYDYVWDWTTNRLRLFTRDGAAVNSATLTNRKIKIVVLGGTI